MHTSLYVLRNRATAAVFRHDTLDEALAALNFEVGERDLWVLFELNRLGAARRVAEGQGHIKRPRGPTEFEAARAVIDDVTAYEWRRLVGRRSN